MAKVNSRYIQFYTPGTAAVKVEVQEEHKWAPLPAPKPEKKMVIYVDPIAILSFVVAISMLVLLAVGIQELNTARREVATLEHYVAELTAENHTLAEEYKAGYNADEIRQKALDMGMIPAEEIRESYIFVTLPESQSAEPTLWERAATFLTGLFA